MAVDHLSFLVSLASLATILHVRPARHDMPVIDAGVVHF